MSHWHSVRACLHRHNVSFQFYSQFRGVLFNCVPNHNSVAIRIRIWFFLPDSRAMPIYTCRAPKLYFPVNSKPRFRGKNLDEVSHRYSRSIEQIRRRIARAKSTCELLSTDKQRSIEMSSYSIRCNQCREEIQDACRYSSQSGLSFAKIVKFNLKTTPMDAPKKRKAEKNVHTKQKQRVNCG